MPELVLINYQQRPYPAATGKKRDREREREKKELTTTITTINAAAITTAAIYVKPFLRFFGLLLFF